ncbi:MAG: hypothetical protein WC306_03715, partial [Candidatus Paceibacterota bacterium]
MRENIKYLNSVEGKMKSMESAWEKLSQKTIDDNLVKGWYDLSRAFIDLQSSVGGVVPLITVLGALFSKQLATGVTVVKDKIANMTSNVDKSATSFNKLRWSMVGISAVIFAISTYVGIMNEAKKKAEEVRQKTIEYGKSVGDTASEIDNLSYKIKNLSNVQNRTEEQESELLLLNSDLVSILGDRAKVLQNLTVGTNEYSIALEELLKKEAEMNSLGLHNAVLSAQESLENVKGRPFTDFADPWKSVFTIEEKDFAGAEKLFATIRKLTDASASMTSTFDLTGKGLDTLIIDPLDKSSKSLSEYYSYLKSVEDVTESYREELMASSDAKDKEIANNIYLSDSYKNLQYEISRYEEQVQALIKAQVLEEVNNFRKTKSIPKTTEAYEVYKNSLLRTLNVSGELYSIAEKMLDSLFPALSGSVDDASWALIAANETIKEAIGEFNDLMDKIDSIQSSYKLLSDAVDEYKTSGKLSLDTVQDLLSMSDEQINALDMESGELKLNKKALEELTKARLDELKASAINTAYLRIQALITEKELKQDLTEETEKYTYAELVQLATESALGEQGDIILQALKSRLALIDDLIAGTGLLSTVESEEAISALEILDNIQSAYSTFTEATKEYAKTGGFSFDTLQKILSLSPEYLKFLFDENGQISLNTETLKRYQEAKIEALRVELWDNHLAKLEEIRTSEEEGKISTEESIVLQEEATDAYLNSEAVVDAFTGSLGEEKSALEEAQEALEDANSTLDEMVSAYDTLKDAIKEYNKTGVLSVDTFQALMNLSPEFLQMFFNQATAAGNAEAAIYGQAEALKVAKIQELQAAAAADILKLATGKVGDMSDVAKSAVAAMGNKAAIAGNKMAIAANQAAALGSGLQAVVKGAEGNLTGINLDDFRKQAGAIINSYKNIANSIASISVSGFGGGGGGSSAATDQAKAIAEA